MISIKTIQMVGISSVLLIKIKIIYLYVIGLKIHNSHIFEKFNLNHHVQEDLLNSPIPTLIIINRHLKFSENFDDKAVILIILAKNIIGVKVIVRK